VNNLSKAESAILEAFLENGCTNETLAERFGISEWTVKRHVFNILNKTGYSSRTELAVNELHKRYARAAAA
jgi:DNA-binding NarL/FixJ family response regulator